MSTINAIKKPKAINGSYWKKDCSSLGSSIPLVTLKIPGPGIIYTTIQPRNQHATRKQRCALDPDSLVPQNTKIDYQHQSDTAKTGGNMNSVSGELIALLNTFKSNRQLTYDVLDSLNDEELHRRWPRPGLDTFAKHFSEMAAVQLSFIDAIDSGQMDFSTVPEVFSFKDDLGTDELRNKLMVADSSLEEHIQCMMPDTTIDWGDGTNLSASLHIVNLISHETFHQGMMAMAMYMFDIPLPSSWIINWAMPQVGTLHG